MSGKDKAKIVVDGQSILKKQVDLFSSYIENIAIVGVADSYVQPNYDNHDALCVVGDRVGGLGPMDGIAGALAWNPKTWLLVIGCDMPFVKVSLAQLLLKSRTVGAQIVAFHVNRKSEPLFAVYHQSVLSEFDSRLAQKKLRLRDVLNQDSKVLQVVLISEKNVARIEPNHQSFRNLNTFEDVLHSGGKIK